MSLLSICWQTSLTSIRGEMQYRASFVMTLLFGLLFQSIGFIFVAIILTQFDAVRGWGLWEVGLLYGIRLSAHGLWTVAMNQLFRFDSIIKEGIWDRYLIRPLPLWSQLMFSNFRIPPLGDFASGMILLVAALINVDITWTPAFVLFLPLAIIGGAMIDGAFQLGSAAFAFRYLETLPLRIVFDDLQGRFGSYPMSIFDRPMQMVLTWFIPMAFMARIPSTVLLDRTGELPFPGWVAWLSPVLGGTLMTLAVLLFRRQSRFYQSSGH